MLRFIKFVKSADGKTDRFQYISCYGLSKRKRRNIRQTIIFQYISCYGLSFPKSNRRRRKKQFQYISCYGLSRQHLRCDHHLRKFQYISCYGLSGEDIVSKIQSGVFQYISCYGLSYSSTTLFSSISNFNTSHVTVYRCFVLHFLSSFFISIHLMLRFIEMGVSGLQQVKAHFNTSHVTVYPYMEGAYNLRVIFQYISCYGLSRAASFGM